MRQASSVVLASLTVVALLAQPLESTADPIPIQITGGGLSITSGGTLSLAGDGFAFDGSVHVVGGVLGPWITCMPCLPGAEVSLTAHWVGGDLRGTATFEGTTYTNLGSQVGASPQGSVTFSGAVSAPPASGLSSTVTAPFDFIGTFIFPQNGGISVTTAALFGVGTASLEFWRVSDDLPWSYRSAVYQFDDVEPIPEPGTMILVGTAMAALALRRRRSGRQPDQET